MALAVLGAAVALPALALGATDLIGSVAAQFCVAVVPVAIGAAILRYRLYDLDRIISRTLAYGLLTVLLGGGYAGLVLGLGQLLGRDSPLVVPRRPWRWPLRCRCGFGLPTMRPTTRAREGSRGSLGVPFCSRDF